MKQLEIERKFIVHKLPEGLLKAASATLIRQGYLLIEGDQELRIRQRDQMFWMTLKQGSGLQRGEQECPIPETQFNMLWPLTAGRRLEKIRYLLPHDGCNFEFDLFKGDLSPLIILEVEFESIEASQAFRVPDFVTQEVTEEKAYKNATLATCGLPKLSF